MSVIETYLSDLDRRLRGSQAAKVDLLTEARDGLHDAAEAYREGGSEERDAERRAVTDFGPVTEIARAYQQELALRGDIGILWKLIVGVPAFQLSWEVARIVSFGEWSEVGQPTPQWYLFIVDLMGVLVISVPVIGIPALLGTRLLARRIDGARLARAAKWPTGLAVAANLLAVLVLAVGTAILDPSRMYMSFPCAVLAVGWAVFSVWLVPLALRSWRPRPPIAA